jgi:hypothetical protein
VLLRLAPQDKCVIVFVFSSLLIRFFFLFSIGSERVVQWALVMAPFQPKKSIFSRSLPFISNFLRFLCLAHAISSSIRVPYLFGIYGQFIQSSSIHSFFHCIKLTITAFIIHPPPTFFNFVVLICSLIINYFLFPLWRVDICEIYG